MNTPHEQPTAAVALISCPGNWGSDRDICLIKRAEHPIDPWSGHIALPGGRPHPDDASLLHTALRETCEETGILLNKVSPTPLEPLRAGKTKPHAVLVQPYHFHLSLRPLTHPDPVEVQQILWLSEKFFKDRSNHTHSLLPDHPEYGDQPGIWIGSQFLWGFTYAVLKKFLYL